MKTYILSITARRKGAKRHIVCKSSNIEELRKIGINNINDKYVTDIYDGKWNLVEHIK